MFELHVASCVLLGQRIDLTAVRTMADSVSGRSGFTDTRLHISVPENHMQLGDLEPLVNEIGVTLRVMPSRRPYGLRAIGESWVEHIGHVVQAAPYGAWILALSPWEQVYTTRAAGLYHAATRAQMSSLGAVHVSVGNLWSQDSMRVDGWWGPRELPRLFRNDRRVAFSEVDDWSVLLPDMARMNVPLINSGVRILSWETATLARRRRRYDFLREHYRYDIDPAVLEELLDVSGNMQLEKVKGLISQLDAGDARGKQLAERAARLLKPSALNY